MREWKPNGSNGQKPTHHPWATDKPKGSNGWSSAESAETPDVQALWRATGAARDTLLALVVTIPRG
eukprot:9468438-Pyramimonas_sp.AAC.1